jgi:hypothetical protein
MPVSDTVRDAEIPASVRELMETLEPPISYTRTVLDRELDRMQAQVLRTEVDDDRLVVLFARSSPLAADQRKAFEGNLHVLADGAVLVRTPWIMSSRDRVTGKVVGEHTELLTEHDDPRGIPCFPSACIARVATSSSYEAAIRQLGDLVVFL